MKERMEIFNTDGSVAEYTPISVRIPQFLKDYPKADGWRVKIEAMDPLSLKPGLARILEKAVEAGAATEVGDLPLPSMNSVVFRASLIDKDGNEVETASALRSCVQYKDWEKGETAARQRLLAALGYGGDLFAEDERGDMEDQGLRFRSSASEANADPSAKKQAEVEHRDENRSDLSVGTEPQEEKGVQPTVKPSRKEPVRRQGAASSTQAAANKPNGEAVSKAILRQIEHQARLKGIDVDVSTLTSADEAKAKLKELLQA